MRSQGTTERYKCQLWVLRASCLEEPTAKRIGETFGMWSKKEMESWFGTSIVLFTPILKYKKKYVHSASILYFSPG